MAADLPDTFLLEMFEKLSANDRLNVSQVCPNWYHRVREVNRTVRCLTITVGSERLERSNFNNKIAKYIFGYIPCIKEQLMKETKVDREHLQPSIKFNTLQFSIDESSTIGPQLNSTFVMQITSAFPATTKLNFISQAKKAHFEYLVQMLETGWKDQLTALTVIDLQRISVLPETSQRLFTSINQLPALQRLALVLLCQSKEGLQMTDLPVLARLKEVRFVKDVLRDDDLSTFLSNVQQYAASNEQLQIDLQYGFVMPVNQFKAEASLLNQQTRERIVRFDSQSSLRATCTSYPHLLSLSISCCEAEECERMFALICSHLPFLLHLKLALNLRKGGAYFEQENGGQVMLPSPTSQLSTVKALELSLTISSCTQRDLGWLNLPVIVPNVQVVHLEHYCCFECNIKSWQYKSEGSTSSQQQATIRKCLRTGLTRLGLANAVPLEQTFISVEKDDFTISAKQLFEQ